MAPFLFAAAPAAPVQLPVIPVVAPSLAPTTLLGGSPPFAVILGQLVDPAIVIPSEARELHVQVPRSARDDSDTPMVAELMAMMAMPIMPIVVQPTPESAPDAPLTITVNQAQTVEQAIATIAASLGVSVTDIQVEAITTDPLTHRPTHPPLNVDNAAAPRGIQTEVFVDPVGPIHSDASLLIPRFRSRVERVIDRMKAEHGLEVTIRETFRSQERQDGLFAQGRTEPGPIVTWTRRSLHTDGLAADLAIAGMTENQVAYEQLAAIAVEEGLSTLGSKDPGHVELRAPAAVATTAQAVKQARATPAFKPSITRRTTVAAVEAPVLPTAPTVPPAPKATPVASVERPAAVAPVIPPDMPEQDSEAAPHAPMPIPIPIPIHHSAETAEVAQTTNINARIEDIQSIADAIADRPVTGIVLRLDGDAGSNDRIRIDVRRNVVDTSMQAADAAVGARLTSDTHTLRSALERQGLEVGSIDVRPSLRGPDNTRRDNDSSQEQHRRQSPDSRQRQRRHPNQNGESPR